MTNSEFITASIDNTSVSLSTPCLICGDTVTIANYYAGPKICDKCKEAVLHVRQQLERNPLEFIYDTGVPLDIAITAVSDTFPCDDCDIGWASLSTEGCVGCEDTCEKFAKWMVE